MSAAQVKSKLKAAREAIQAKNYESAENIASGVLSLDEKNYNGLVFQGLSLSHLSRPPDAAIQVYRKAIDVQPKTALAWQGLVDHCERCQRWDDEAEGLEGLANVFKDSGDASKCLNTLERLVGLRREHGTNEQLLKALSHLLPSGPFYEILSDDSQGASALGSSKTLTFIEESIRIAETTESKRIDSEVERRRMRIATGSQPIRRSEQRRMVVNEIKGGSDLPHLYNQLLSHPSATSDQRREIERKLLAWKVDFLDSLSVKARSDDKEIKATEDSRASLCNEIIKLARDITLLKVPDSLAWKIMFDWHDVGINDLPDRSQLSDYVALFPDSGLAKVILGYTCLYERDMFHFMQGEDEDLEDPSGFLEDGFASSQDSLFASRLAIRFYYEEEEDWTSVVDVCDNSLKLIKSMTQQYQVQLNRVQSSLNRPLAVSLARISSHGHQLRALRMLEDVLAKENSDTRYVELTAKGYVLSQLKRWDSAIEAYLQALESFANTNNLQQDESRPVQWTIRASLLNAEAQEDCGWCYIQSDQIDEGLIKLDAALTQLESVGNNLATMGNGVKTEINQTLEERRKEKLESGWKWATARTWWRKGTGLWRKGGTSLHEPSQAFACFTRSIKTVPLFAPAFTSLGLYYADVASPSDHARASKCFQKAFELDPEETVAARRLAEEFSKEGEWDLVETIARRVASNIASDTRSIENVWTWRAIGIADLRARRPNDAIVAFQKAIRSSPEDVHSWVQLGNAYRMAGKHVAALKSFAKALELRPDEWYPKLGKGEVQRQMGLWEAAVESFEEVLASISDGDPTRHGVIIVLAETEIAWAHSLRAQGLFFRAEASFFKAILLAVELIDQIASVRIAWKIVGNALEELGSLEDQGGRGTLDDSLTKLLDAISRDDADSKIPHIDSVTVANALSTDLAPLQRQLFVGTLAYKIRVLMELENDSVGWAWFDLARSLFRCSQVCPSAESDDNPHSTQAIMCVRSALQAEPANTMFWNALGVMAFDLNPRLCQHAFIRAVEFGPRNAIAWVNLGFFYIKHEDPDLASEAFLKAQTLDPDCASAWMGQSMLAHLNGHQVEHKALSEHAFNLGCTQAGFPFALAAWREIASRTRSLSIPSLFKTVAGPLYALSRFVATNPSNAEALHVFALICELSGLLDDARSALQRAAPIIEAEYEQSEDTVVARQYALAQFDLGRVNLASGDYSGALEALETSMSLLDTSEETDTGENSSSMEGYKARCLCLIGIAHSFLGDLESAVESLQTSQESSKDDRIKSEAAVALCRCLWEKNQDGSREIAKNELLESAALGTVDVAATLAAVAILTSDEALLDAATSELQTLDPHTKAQKDAAGNVDFLLASQRTLQGNQANATRILAGLIHQNPSNTEHRLQLCRHLFRCGEVETALRTFLPSEGEGNSGEIANAKSADLERQELLIRAAAELLVSDSDQSKPDSSLLLAQKAVRVDPANETAWEVLNAMKGRSPD